MSLQDSSRVASPPRAAATHDAGRLEGFVASVYAFFKAGEHSLPALESHTAEAAA